MCNGCSGPATTKQFEFYTHTQHRERDTYWQHFWIIAISQHGQKSGHWMLKHKGICIWSLLGSVCNVMSTGSHEIVDCWIVGLEHCKCQIAIHLSFSVLATAHIGASSLFSSFAFNHYIRIYFKLVDAFAWKSQFQVSHT